MGSPRYYQTEGLKGSITSQLAIWNGLNYEKNSFCHGGVIIFVKWLY